MPNVADAVGTHPQAAAESNIIDHHEISAAQQQDWHAPMAVPTIARIDDFAAFTEVGKLLDSKAENWFGWSQSMYNLFDLYDVREYVQGEVPCPDPVHDPVGAVGTITIHMLKFSSQTILLPQRMCTSMDAQAPIGCGITFNPYMSLPAIMSTSFASS